MSIEALEGVIDTKINELKAGLLAELHKSIDEYVATKKVEIDNYFNEKKNEAEQAESIKVIQQHVNELKAANIKLVQSVDDLSQYVRRPNLRIFGVPVYKDETCDDLRNMVGKMINDNNIDIPTQVRSIEHTGSVKGLSVKMTRTSKSNL